MAGCPHGPRARLNFEAGKIIVLELGTDCQAQKFRHDRNFVLHECAVEGERSIGGKQRNIQ